MNYHLAGYILLCALAILALCAGLAIAAYRSGYQKGTFDRQIAAYGTRLEASRAAAATGPGRHRLTRPGEDLPALPPAQPPAGHRPMPAQGSRTGLVSAAQRGRDWYRTVPPAPPSGGRAPRLPAGASPRRAVTRAHTSAADIAPVFWPEPGTRIPLGAQAAPRPGYEGDTGTMPRVRLTTADTGEIRAIGASYVDGLRRRGAVIRAAIERGEPVT